MAGSPAWFRSPRRGWPSRSWARILTHAANRQIPALLAYRTSIPATDPPRCVGLSAPVSTLKRTPARPPIIDPAKGDQFFAWIEADRTSGAIHIAYYTGESDYWSQRIQVKLATINPGGTFPESVSGMKILTHPADNPAGDPLFGYHAHYIRGTFGTETHTQRDNYLIEVDP
jgi:hypothetical protein